MQHHGGMNACVLAASVLVASLASPAFAGPPTDTLRQGVDRVLRIVEKPGDHPAEIRKVERRSQSAKAESLIAPIRERYELIGVGLHPDTMTPATSLQK